MRLRKNVSTRSGNSSSRNESQSLDPHFYEEFRDDVIQWDFAILSVRRRSKVVSQLTSFFLHVIILVMFCVFHLDGYNITQSRLMSQSLYNTLSKSELSRMKTSYFVKDLKSVAEYTEYVTEVLSPLLTSTNGLLGGNILLGSLRVRTHRVRSNTCSLMDRVIPVNVSASVLDCYGAYSAGKEDRGVEMNASRYGHQLWQYADCHTLGGAKWVGMLYSYHCGGYYFDVPFWTSKSFVQYPQVFQNPNWRVMQTEKFTAALQLRFKAVTPFLDDSATRFVASEFYVYNPSVQLFGSVKVTGEVGSGGLWFCRVYVESFHLWTKEDNNALIYLSVFLVVVVIVLTAHLHRTITRLVGGTFAFSTKAIVSHSYYLVVCVLLVVSCVLQFVLITKRWARSFDLYEHTYTESYPVILEPMRVLSTQLRYLNGSIIILLFIWISFYFGILHWMNTVTQTLIRVQTVIVSVVLLFTMCLMVFTMTAYTYLHRIVVEFRSVNSTFQTLFYVLIRQVDLNTLIVRGDSNQAKGMKFILFAFVFISYTIVLALFVGVLRSSLLITQELEQPTSEMFIAWRHVRYILRHPNLWPRFFIRYLCGQGDAELLSQCANRLVQYRHLLYPVVEDKAGRRRHYLTRERFMKAMQVGKLERLKEKTKIEMEKEKGNPTATGLGNEPSMWSQVKKGSRHCIFPVGFSERIWKDLLEEWRRTVTSKQSLRIKKEVWWTSEGVQQVLEDHIMLLKEFPRRLYDLESKTYDVQDKLNIEDPVSLLDSGEVPPPPLNRGRAATRRSLQIYIW